MNKNLVIGLLIFFILYTNGAQILDVVCGCFQLGEMFLGALLYKLGFFHNG
jgi:hypothetical protein